MRNASMENCPLPRLRGIIPALITPFNPDGTLKLGVLPEYLDFLKSAGCTALFVGGSTGEGFLQTFEERKLFVEAVVREAGTRMPAIMHVGAMNPAEAFELARVARKLKVEAVSSVIPFYYEYSLDDIKHYYEQLAEASRLPLIAYYVPQATNATISLEAFIDTMSSITELIGVKYTSPDLYSMQMLGTLSRKPLSLFGGRDQMALPFLAMGAQGLIGATFNMIPEVFVGIYRAFAEGNIAKAQQHQLEANTFLYRIKQIVGQKYHDVLRLRGIDVGRSRRCGTELPAENTGILEKMIADLVSEQKHVLSA